jgi:hypothetical protein
MKVFMGRHDFDRDSGLKWIIPRWHEYLKSMPDALLAETLCRARRLAAERPKSYLAQHLKVLYGEALPGQR